MNHKVAYPAIYQELRELCQDKQVAILYVFGSRQSEIKDALDGAGRINKIDSTDVDMGVKFIQKNSVPVRKKVELSVALEDLFEINRVDLVALEEADPFLAVNVIRGKRLYCEDEYLADEYELYVLRRAGDLAPFERMRIENILG